MRTLQAQYLSQFGIEYEGVLYHDTNTPVREMDFWIRNFIGKTDDIESLHAGRCSHQAVLERERDKEGKNPEEYCRKCGLFLGVDGVLRCNDFLVLRNPFCRGPICGACMKDGGDVFYAAYRRGLAAYYALKGWQV